MPSTTWDFSNVQGWKGLKPSSKENSLIQKQPNTTINPPGWDQTMLSKAKVDEVVAQQNSLANRDVSSQNIAQIREKRAWNVAMGPFKSLPMSAFMMYMVGGQISIWTIMMCGVQGMNAVSKFLQWRPVLKSFEQQEQQVLLFLFWVMGQMATMALYAWQFNRMGLLPTHPSDWLTFSDPQVNLEVSSENFI